MLNNSILLLPDCTEPKKLTPANGEAFTLEELQKLVGGCIESVFHDESGWLFVNEDGKRLNLPLNNTASRVYRELTGRNDVILGPAIFVPRDDRRGLPDPTHQPVFPSQGA